MYQKILTPLDGSPRAEIQAVEQHRATHPGWRRSPKKASHKPRGDASIASVKQEK